MPACNAPRCPRSDQCGRHEPAAQRAMDYSHGPWFDAWMCFWHLPKPARPPTWEPVSAGISPTSSAVTQGCGLFLGEDEA